MLIKTPLLHQSLGPSVFLSFFLPLSFSFWLIPWSMKAGCITQGISASFLLSLSSSTPDHQVPVQYRTNKWRLNRHSGTRGKFGRSDPHCLLRPVSTKIRVNWLESPLTFLLYFSTYLKFRNFWFHASK